jgi:hypothetical protein
MDRVSIVTYCDIDWMRDQTLVPAAHKQVPITVGDRTAKLDACGAHLDEVHRALEPFMPPVDADAQAAETLRAVNPEGMQHGATEPADTPPADALADGSPEWWDAYKAWMDAEGIKWKFPTGVSYSPKSKSLFRAHLAGLRDKSNLTGGDA